VSLEGIAYLLIKMLIGLVRDSVMQCFCHSCNVPVMWTSGKYVTHFGNKKNEILLLLLLLLFEV
jgi:hypothetical protein